MFRRNGFTLVEILFVVIIAAGILMFSFPSYRAMRERARFQAASGMLIDLGNAVESITQDLALQGVSVRVGSSSPYYFKYEGASATLAAQQTLAENVKKVAAGRSREKRVLDLLLGAGYLKDFTPKGNFSYYVLTNSVSPSANTVGLCTKSTDETPLNGQVIACMVKDNSGEANSDRATSDECYAGARYYKGGRFQTIRTPGCKTNTND